jgi:hypothetical protein
LQGSGLGRQRSPQKGHDHQGAHPEFRHFVLLESNWTREEVGL